jgi:hypothetical protein
MSSKQRTLSETAKVTIPPRSFIESPRFPVAEISEASRVEKGREARRIGRWFSGGPGSR